MENKQVLDISTSTIIRVFAVLLVIAFLFSIWPILANIFLAIVIASGVEPAVKGLSKVKIPRFICAVIVYMAGFLIFTSVFYMVFPSLITEIKQLSTDIPGKYSELITGVEQFFGRSSAEVNIQDKFGIFFNDIQARISGEASNIFVFISDLFGNLMSFMLVLVISFYLVIKKNGIEHFLESFVPDQHKEYAVDLWKRVQSRLGRWFQVQIILGVFVGTFMFFALWLLGVKYALTIAFMVGVLEIIPVIGPITAGLITFVLVSSQSPLLALGAIAIYFGIEQIQQNLLVPNFLSKAIGLNPIIMIIALLVGAQLMGFWGIVLAIPISVTLLEFLKDFRK